MYLSPVLLVWKNDATQQTTSDTFKQYFLIYLISQIIFKWLSGQSWQRRYDM